MSLPAAKREADDLEKGLESRSFQAYPSFSFAKLSKLKIVRRGRSASTIMLPEPGWPKVHASWITRCLYDHLYPMLVHSLLPFRLYCMHAYATHP